MNLEEHIKKIEKDLADMKEQLKKEKESKWKIEPFEADHYYISHTGDIHMSSSVDVVTTIQTFGMKRATAKLAEISRDRMRASNMLEYWAMIVDPDFRDEGLGNIAYYIYMDSKKRYFIAEHKTSRHMAQVYMSRKAAIKICDALNSGELKL